MKDAQKKIVLKVLGSGCKKCNQLEENTQKALEEMKIEGEIEHITDFAKIASYGVMSTPALVYDDKVLCFGAVLKKEEIMKLLNTVL